MALPFETPYEISQQLASKARECRLELNFSQQTLSKRAGVSLGTLKKFESTGKISLESLLKIANVLNRLKEFDLLFLPKSPASLSLKALKQEKTRKRGRK